MHGERSVPGKWEKVGELGWEDLTTEYTESHGKENGESEVGITTNNTKKAQSTQRRSWRFLRTLRTWVTRCNCQREL